MIINEFLEYVDMKEVQSKLPDDFQELASLVSLWAKPTESERNVVRWSARKSDFVQFYSLFMPRLQDALDTLGRYSDIKDMPSDTQTLAYLCFAFAESSPHHELYGDDAMVPFSFDPRRFVRL